jgi:hypothetical protein
VIGTEMIHRIRIAGVLLWTAVFVAVGGLMAGGWLTLFSDTFKINCIEIRGNAFLTDNEIKLLLVPFDLGGKLIWLADLSGPEKFLVDNSRISAAVFEKHFPNRLVLNIKETEEFATVVFVSGRRCTVDREGWLVRELDNGAPPVGPIICGFSEAVLKGAPFCRLGFRDEVEAWAGFSSRPEAAGVLRIPGDDDITALRERIRFGGALYLAEATGINRRPSVSSYDYIGLDANYDLFLSYPGFPSIVVAGFTDGPGVVDDIAGILACSDKGAFDRYDYIDLHLAKFGRGVVVSEMGTFAVREWSDGNEAVRIAAWETLAEIERRSSR